LHAVEHPYGVTFADARIVSSRRETLHEVLRALTHDRLTTLGGESNRAIGACSVGRL